jgi:hypothetical protein
MANRIFRGCAEETVSNKTVAGAYLPGTFVTEGASTLTQAAAPTGLLRVLANRDWYSDGGLTATDPLLTAYASGDTADAYAIEQGKIFQVAAAAATYTFGQELTITTGGRVTAAASTNIVIGFSRTAGAKSSGDLIDVEIANFYVKA